jgi:transcription-repair coupling factor (superfamily II helicase)
MRLSHLIPAISRTSELQLTLGTIESGDSIQILDVPSPARAALIAAIVQRQEQPVLIVSSREDRAIELYSTVQEFLPDSIEIELWPAPEGVPYDRLPRDAGVSGSRVSILAGIAASPPEPVVVFTSVSGLAHYVFQPETLSDRILSLSTGQRIDERSLLQWATGTGYEVVPLVTGPGQVARRGGIVDIFNSGASDPIRIDLFGDEIESIRAFHPASQRSYDKIDSVDLLPAIEVDVWNLPQAAAAIQQLNLDTLRPEVRSEFEQTLTRAIAGGVPASIELFSPYLPESAATLLDHFPKTSLVMIDDPGTVDFAAAQRASHAAEALNAAIQSGELLDGLKPSIASWKTMKHALQEQKLVSLGALGWSENVKSTTLTGFGLAPQFAGRLGDLRDAVRTALAEGWRLTIATDQSERITHALEASEIFPRRQKRSSLSTSELEPGSVEVVHSDLDGGWAESASRTLVLTDREIFGFRKSARLGPARQSEFTGIDPHALTPGEHVVHIDHGIARFTGLMRIELAGVEREYLVLEFAKGDKLYVPVDQSHRVTKYSSGGLSPDLSKLGSGEWVRTKQRVRRAVREMAFELLNLYASRETVKGFEFPADTLWDLELADSFPYAETADQLKAVQDVASDMQSDEPMDRLICGDVGFGKTEVAIRAAFKAVNAGKQVAVLVPTTVLALQHLSTFSQRLGAFPVRIEMLSRLRSAKEQRVVLDGLRDGTVDIVIGTHRLVQSDVTFKDLGLVIIDEEQRFGVRQKEFLKQLRTEVDVITMSATPIPRTLHTALAGIRDISIIDTPPQSRLPIRTFVTASDDHLLREVILREMDRGGQIFVVHNRVATIGKLAAHLQHLIPEARIGIGHGQMDEEVLEQIMIDFINQEFDVLVCTTIIESGVDIPNANTIVIDNADTLGLTQLYQLRGRVGRGANRAYAYLLYRPKKPLSADAQARLEAIQEATELGAGMKLAMRDMEIRGAGNILGAEQSGHIAEVGYELYLRLLSQAVEEIKAGRPMSDQPAVTLDLPLTALIPASYIQDVELRLNTYRKIASVTHPWEIQKMREELTDRFGELPEEVERLLSLISLRLKCEELGLESVVERERQIVLRPVDTGQLNRQRIHARLGPAVKFTPNSVRIRLIDLEEPWSDALDFVIDELETAQVTSGQPHESALAAVT